LTNSAEVAVSAAVAAKSSRDRLHLQLTRSRRAELAPLLGQLLHLAKTVLVAPCCAQNWSM